MIELELERDKLNHKLFVMKADLDFARSTLKDCRNELCLKCNRYHEAHKGACDGCRWKDEWQQAIDD